MLVMPPSSKNFQTLADRIASDFFEKGISLEDGVVKVATAADMVPEEVKRLTEKSNTAASIRFLKSAEDKKASFTLADTQKVLARTHPVDSPVAEKTASAGRQELPTTRERASVSFEAIFPSIHRTEKRASAEKQAAVGDIFTLREAISRTKQEKLAAEVHIQEAIDSLASEYSVWRGPDFDKLASEAVAAYGNIVKPVLHGLAEYLQVPLTFKKCAGVIDDRTKHMQLMAYIRDNMQDLVKLDQKLAQLTDTLDHAWSKAVTP